MKAKYFSHILSFIGLFAFFMSFLLSFGADNSYGGPQIFMYAFNFFWTLFLISPIFSIFGIIIAAVQIIRNRENKVYKIGLILNVIWTTLYIIAYILMLFLLSG